MTALNFINKTIFWLALILIATIIFSFTLGQILPIEFADYKIRNDYYSFAFDALPFAILLTLFGTIKKKNKKSKNWTIVGLTILAAVICFFVLVSVMFSLGFGSWTTQTVLYRQKDNAKITINKQILDIGALGYGGYRVVQLKPCLKYFQSVKQIDTTIFDKKDWSYVNEEVNPHD